MQTAVSSVSLTASLRLRPEIKRGHVIQKVAARSPVTSCRPVRAAQASGNDLLRLPV